MDLNLAGKVALVTGSSRGIGLHIANMFSQEGCKVILNGRNQNSLEAAISKISNAHFVVGDVATVVGAGEVINNAIAIYGKLDILVCNVGSGTSVPPGSEDEEEWLRVFRKNLLATTNTVAVARDFLAESGGVILCISSICGSSAIDGAPIAYSASKAALNSFVSTSAYYLAKEKIRINALAPGNIVFDGSSWSKKLERSPSEVTAMLQKEVALARFGRPDELASMAVFLCSDRASFATGTLFVLDGGQLRN